MRCQAHVLFNGLVSNLWWMEYDQLPSNTLNIATESSNLDGYVIEWCGNGEELLVSRDGACLVCETRSGFAVATAERFRECGLGYILSCWFYQWQYWQQGVMSDLMMAAGCATWNRHRWKATVTRWDVVNIVCGKAWPGVNKIAIFIRCCLPGRYPRSFFWNKKNLNRESRQNHICNFLNQLFLFEEWHFLYCWSVCLCDDTGWW